MLNPQPVATPITLPEFALVPPSTVSPDTLFAMLVLNTLMLILILLTLRWIVGHIGAKSP